MVITLGSVPSDDLHMSSGPFDPSRFDEVIGRATISPEADLAVDPLPCDPSPSPREALDKVFVRADTSLLIWVFR
jgi:hypothetical protein